MRHPTIGALTRAFPSLSAADIALGWAIMHGDIDPDYVTETEEWDRLCMNQPHWTELLMHALDTVFEGFGVEGLGEPDPYETPKWAPRYEYINMGDTYDTTLIYDREENRLFIGDWGTIAETGEEENEG